MKNFHKLMIAAFLAVIITIFGLSDGIAGLQAGYGIDFFAFTLILPIALWIVTAYFYHKCRKDKASKT